MSPQGELQVIVDFCLLTPGIAARVGGYLRLCSSVFSEKGPAYLFTGIEAIAGGDMQPLGSL